MRIFIQIILPLVTPIIIYSLLAYWSAKRKGKSLPNWEEGQWFWVILVGVFLSVASLVYFATGGADTDAKYQSPRLENGRVLPGQHR